MRESNVQLLQSMKDLEESKDEKIKENEDLKVRYITVYRLV